MQTWKSIRFPESSNKKIYTVVCLIVLLFGAFIRFSYVGSIPHITTIKADAEKYNNLAHNILNQGSYSPGKKTPLVQDTFITPGYPLFLAGILSFAQNENSFYVFAIYLQATLSSLAVLLVFIIGRKFLPYWGALLASFLTAISPQLVVSNGYILTESLFTFLLLLSVYLLLLALKSKNIFLFFLFGLMAGYASLVRPALLLFPLIVVSLPFARFMSAPPGTRLRIGALVAAGILVFWGPWLAFKAQAEHGSANNHSPLVDSFALGSYPNLVFRTPLYRGYPYLEDPDFKKMQKGIGSTLKIVGERAKENPLAYLRWYFLDKPLTYWQWGNIVGAGGPFIYPVKQSIYNTSVLAIDSLLFTEISHPLWLISALVVLVAKLIKMMRARKIPGGDSVILVLAAALAYFTAVHSVLAPLPRYSYPLLPLLYLTAAYGIWKLAGTYKRASESVYNKIRSRNKNILS